MRTSLPASAGLSGSVHSSTLPLPLVSSTHGAQPCALAASPVSSHTLVLTQPATGPLPDSHSVSSASYANWGWWVPKQVSMKLYFIVFGSSIDTWRPERSSGNTLAEGCSEPFLQKAGFSMPRTAAANHTRPFLSNMPLWLLARWLQIFAPPQYAEGSIGFAAAEAWKGGPNDSGALGSATGILKNVTLFGLGSRIAMLSVAYSGEP